MKTAKVYDEGSIKEFCCEPCQGKWGDKVYYKILDEVDK
jgi:hypothetical protein